MFPSALVHLNPALAVQLAAALVVQPDGGGGAPSPTVLRLNLADSRRASAFKRPPKRRPAPAAAPTGLAIRGPVATIGGGGVWAAKGRRLSGHNNAPAASAAPAPPGWGCELGLHTGDKPCQGVTTLDASGRVPDTPLPETCPGQDRARA